MKTDNSKIAFSIKNGKQSIINLITWGIGGPEKQISFSKTYFMLIPELFNLDFPSH